jgi:hypothetical protein
MLTLPDLTLDLTDDPPFLRETEPMDSLESLALQVALLTMETAQLRQRVASLERQREAAGLTDG